MRFYLCVVDDSGLVCFWLGFYSCVVVGGVYRNIVGIFG